MKTGLRSPSEPKCLRTECFKGGYGLKFGDQVPVVELVAEREPVLLNQHAQTLGDDDDDGDGDGDGGDDGDGDGDGGDDGCTRRNLPTCDSSRPS